MIENTMLNQSDKDFDRAQGCFKPSCMACEDRYECDGYLRELESAADAVIDPVIIAMSKERI